MLELARGERLWRRFIGALVFSFALALLVTLVFLVVTSGPNVSPGPSTNPPSIDIWPGLILALALGFTIAVTLAWFWLRACLGTRSEAREHLQDSAPVV